MREQAAGLADVLAERGVRVTKQRTEVLRLLRSLDHPTVAHIYRLLAKRLPNVSKKTVYSVLEMLVAANLASVVTDGGEPYRYEGRTDHHHHARCRICGALVDLPAVGLDHLRGKSPIPEGFEIERVQVTMVGRCRRCSVNR